MKAKFLSAVFVTVLTLFVIMCCARTSFPISLLDEFNKKEDWTSEDGFDIKEPSLEDIFRERNPVHLEIPDNVITVLVENNLVQGKISKFIHSCKESHNGPQCFIKDFTICISAKFVKKDGVTNNISAVEVRFNPATGKAYELIIKSGNRFKTIVLKEGINI